MKKIIASVVLLFAIANGVSAQGLNLGVKAGANMDKVSGQAFKDGYQLGYHLGAFAEIDVTKKWGIQPEVLWNQVNTRHSDNFQDITQNFRESTGSIKLNYISIPVLLRYNVGSFLTLNLGPQFGILRSSERTLLENGREAFKNGDLSMVAGASINLKGLRVYGRYNVGLANINDVDNQEKWKSQQVQLGLGLRLF